MRKLVCFVCILICCLSVFAQGGSEKAFPSKPINIICPSSAGGATDIIARAVASEPCDLLNGQPVIVINQPGGNEMVGAAYVADSKPDGYTLLNGWGAPTFTFARHVGTLPVDTFNDFIPIIGLASYSSCIAVPKDSPFDSIGELIEYAKQHPGELRWTHSNVNGTHYVLGLDFFNKVGIELTEVVNSDGGAAGRNLVAGGNVDVGFFATFLTKGFEDRLKVLVISNYERDPLYPDVPTLAELGYDNIVVGYEVKILAAPADTPQEIIDTLYTIFSDMLNGENCLRIFKEQGYSALGWDTEECLNQVKSFDEQFAQFVADYSN